MILWLALIVTGLLTFGLRVAFVVGWHRLTMPPLLQQALRFVPIAVLVALVVPDLLLVQGKLALPNERLLAGLVAIAVAWRTRNVLLTIASGMASLLLLQLFP